MRTMRGVAPAFVALALVLAACSSSTPEGPDGDTATGPTGGTSTGATGGATGPSGGPTGATGATGSTALDACALVTEADASATLDGATVELVEDPFGEGLLNDPIVGSLETVCYYRPVPDDGDRQVAVVVFTPGSISEDDFEQIVADGSERGGGFNFEMWVIEQTMLVRKGDVVAIVRATTDEGSAPDEGAEYELALLASARIPEAADPGTAACEVLTSGAVAGAIGGEIVPSGGTVLDDQTSACGYAASTTPTVVVLYLTMGPLAATRFEDFRDSAEDEDGFAGIDGLGDAAFQSPAGVTVLVGDTLVDVRVQAFPDAADPGVAAALAEAAVASL